MHIEVWEAVKHVGHSNQRTGNWFWHFKSPNGRIVSDAEAFPSKGNAVRAAKAAVKAIMKRTMWKPEFKSHESEGFTVITWSGVA